MNQKNQKELNVDQHLTGVTELAELLDAYLTSLQLQPKFGFLAFLTANIGTVNGGHGHLGFDDETLAKLIQARLREAQNGH